MGRERRLIAVKEAAAYLGIHVSTMYRMLKHGEIEAIKVRGEWRFEYAKLDAWIDAQKPGRTD